MATQLHAGARCCNCGELKSRYGVSGGPGDTSFAASSLHTCARGILHSPDRLSQCSKCWIAQNPEKPAPCCLTASLGDGPHHWSEFLTGNPLNTYALSALSSALCLQERPAQGSRSIVGTASNVASRDASWSPLFALQDQFYDIRGPSFVIARNEASGTALRKMRSRDRAIVPAKESAADSSLGLIHQASRTYPWASTLLLEGSTVDISQFLEVGRSL